MYKTTTTYEFIFEYHRLQSSGWTAHLRVTAHISTLKSGVKIQYLNFLVRVEALHKFDVLYDEVESAGSKTLSSIILDLGT